jgi:hypothetical protein
MGLCLGAACKLSRWSERAEKMRTPNRATKTALKLFVSVPFLLRAHPSIHKVSYFALTMNKARQ